MSIYEFDQMRRLDAMPGLTGLQQVSGRSDLDFKRWVELDMEYIAKQSLRQDSANYSQDHSRRTCLGRAPTDFVGERQLNSASIMPQVPKVYPWHVSFSVYQGYSIFWMLLCN